VAWETVLKSMSAAVDDFVPFPRVAQERAKERVLGMGWELAGRAMPLAWSSALPRSEWLDLPGMPDQAELSELSDWAVRVDRRWQLPASLPSGLPRTTYPRDDG